MDHTKLQKAIAQNRHFTESRKVSLYSNFSRLEDVNPDGYEANITAWKEVLEDAISLKSFADSCCIEAGPELVAGLTDTKNGVPLSLYCAIDRMIQDGTLLPLTEFRKKYPPVQKSAGVLSTPTKVLGWVFGTMVPTRHLTSRELGGDGTSLKHEKYVDIKAVAKGAQNLTQKLEKYAENQGNNILSKTFSQAQVQELIAGEYSSLDIECFLSYASHNNMINYNKELDVVKLKNAGPITDLDSTITSLRAQIDEVSKREASLTEKIKEQDTKAREAIKTNRNLAKMILQKKQGLEKSHDRTISALNQLESVLHKIDDANDNKQAYQALESSSYVLADLNKRLSIDDVESLIERLQGEVADTDEITSTMADLSLDRNATDREVEELELDDELEQLEEEEAAKRVSKLPTVPQHKLPSKQGERVTERGKNDGGKSKSLNEHERRREKAVAN